jgi:hypothetical protein
MFTGIVVVGTVPALDRESMSKQQDRSELNRPLRSGRRGSVVCTSIVARLGVFIFFTVTILLAAEVVTRWFDGGGLPSVRIFAQNGEGVIELMEQAEAWHRRPRGDVYPVFTGALGLRVAKPNEPSPAPGGWIAVGDSQVFGLGVRAEETFAARATAKGMPMANAGVPGYGVEDALRRAAVLIPRVEPRGILVIVNQANDWEEMGEPVQQRFRVRGGWLLRAADAAAWEGAFMETRLSQLHLFFHAAQLLHVATHGPRVPAPAAWIDSPQSYEPVTRKMARAIELFAATYPQLSVVLCFLPVDFATGRERARQSPFRDVVAHRIPWEDHELRDQLMRSLSTSPKIDLLPALRDRPDAFLEDDYHLSPTGHAVVADQIVNTLTARQRGP